MSSECSPEAQHPIRHRRPPQIRITPHHESLWRDKAACIDSDADFFPDPKSGDQSAQIICQTCSVRSDCLRHALTWVERNGIWGGETELKLKAMRRAIRAGRATIESFLSSTEGIIEEISSQLITEQTIYQVKQYIDDREMMSRLSSSAQHLLIMVFKGETEEKILKLHGPTLDDLRLKLDEIWNILYLDIRTIGGYE